MTGFSISNIYLAAPFIHSFIFQRHQKIHLIYSFIYSHTLFKVLAEYFELAEFLLA